MADPSWQRELCALLTPSLTLLSDGVDQAAPFFDTPTPDPPALTQLGTEEARRSLAALLERIGEGALDAEGAQALLAEAATAAGIKKGVLMKSLRAALLGSLQGPDLVSTWLLLHRTGADRSRIAASL
jgi:glutamyl-tRNA synthetase